MTTGTSSTAVSLLTSCLEVRFLQWMQDLLEQGQGGGMGLQGMGEMQVKAHTEIIGISLTTKHIKYYTVFALEGRSGL